MLFLFGVYLVRLLLFRLLLVSSTPFSSTPSLSTLVLSTTAIVCQHFYVSQSVLLRYLDHIIQKSTSTYSTKMFN